MAIPTAGKLGGRGSRGGRQHGAPDLGLLLFIPFLASSSWMVARRPSLWPLDVVAGAAAGVETLLHPAITELTPSSPPLLDSPCYVFLLLWG